MAKVTVHIPQCDIKYYDETTDKYTTPKFDSTTDPCDISAEISADQLINLVSVAHNEAGGLTQPQIRQLLNELAEDPVGLHTIVKTALKIAYDNACSGSMSTLFKAAAQAWNELREMDY